MVESLRLAIQMLAPVMPGVHKKVNELLGLPECENWETDLHWDFQTGRTVVGRKNDFVSSRLI